MKARISCKAGTFKYCLLFDFCCCCVFSPCTLGGSSHFGGSWLCDRESHQVNPEMKRGGGPARNLSYDPLSVSKRQGRNNVAHPWPLAA